ncbi:MAG: hypothetical protein JXR19_06990 [Bacteroidia bacterium]
MLFLISGTGFHIDLEYCCGNLEKLGLFDHLSIELDDCCPEEKRESHDCMENDHVVKSMESQDLQSITKVTIQKMPYSKVANVIAPLKNQWKSNAYTTIGENQLHPPPILILQQRFLC